MKFLKELEEVFSQWMLKWGGEPPREDIVKAMREDGLSIEDAARIAPEGYSYEKD